MDQFLERFLQEMARIATALEKSAGPWPRELPPEHYPKPEPEPEPEPDEFPPVIPPEFLLTGVQAHLQESPQEPPQGQEPPHEPVQQELPQGQESSHEPVQQELPQEPASGTSWALSEVARATERACVKHGIPKVRAVLKEQFGVSTCMTLSTEKYSDYLKALASL